MDPDTVGTEVQRGLFGAKFYWNEPAEQTLTSIGASSIF